MSWRAASANCWTVSKSIRRSEPLRARVLDVRLIELPTFAREDGELVVAESAGHVPFAIARVFTLRAPKGAVRGSHAHKACAQFMMCVLGAVEVTCDDGIDHKFFRLERGNQGLFVPASLWASETFVADQSVLTVLCDRPYEADDYIRDHAAFLAWRRA